MRKVNVEVLEDASHPEGGFAVIRLQGLDAWPDGAGYRLKPVEARGASDNGFGASWPQGEQRPRAVRGTPAGIELLVGPEIVECPALLPGTLGVIEVQAAGIRGEFLWPSIRPTARPRRRNLRVVRPQSEGSALGKSIPIGLSPEVQHAAGSGGAAAYLDAGARIVNRSVAREGSAPGSAPDLTQSASVTAFDHGVPAGPSVAEAVGGNVVHLSAIRDTAAQGGTDGPVFTTADQPDGESIPPAASAELRCANDGGAVPQASRHPRWVAMAASVAVLLFGGAILLRELPHMRDDADQSRRVALQNQTKSISVEVVESLPAKAAAGNLPKEADPDGVTETDRATSEIGPNAAEEPASASDTAREAPAPTEPPRVPIIAATQEVTLRMRGGGFQIAGELKGYDGAKYVIETKSAGVLTMDAARFECIGEPCSKPAGVILELSERPSPVKPDLLRIEGAPSLASAFIPQLIRDYAQSIGASVVAVQPEGGEGALSARARRFRILDTRAVELATIEVHSTGTAAGLSSLERGAAAIALVDRPGEAEQSPRVVPRVRRRASQQPPAQAGDIMIGLDAVAAITSPQSTVPSLSLDNLAKVLAGEISDWYELGQAPGPIRVYLPTEGSGTLETFARLAMRPRGLDFARSARRLASDEEVSEAVMRDPAGIALVSLAAQRGARAINLETSCGLIVRPTGFAVKTGEYPLIRSLSLKVAPQLVQPSARGLARIAQSGDVINAIVAAKVIDTSFASLPIEEQSERMAWAANAPSAAFDAAEFRQLLSDLTGASRLSATFRFVSGTNELDQRSRLEVQRLAAALKEPELAGKRIILAGFTDASGRFAANVAAASRRAGQVRSALLAAAQGLDQRLVQSKGYGPIAPVACNGTPEGTRLNRRVEVWVAG